jgi:hypothetical protein
MTAPQSSRKVNEMNTTLLSSAADALYSPKHAKDSAPRFTPHVSSTMYDMPVIRKRDLVKHAIKASWKRFISNDDAVITTVIVALAAVASLTAVIIA